MKYFFLFFLLFPAFARSQQLRLEEIMKGPGLTGNAPEDFYWSHDGKTVYFNWNATNEPGSSLWKFIPGTKSLSKAEEMHPNYYDPENPSSFFVSDDGLRMDAGSGKSILIYPGNISDFQPANKQLFFRDGMNCFAYSHENGLKLIATFTNDQQTEESLNTLEQQQLELFSIVKKDSLTKAWNKQRQNQVPYISIPQDHKLVFSSVSADGKTIIFRCDKNTSPHWTKMPEYVTESGEVDTRLARPKVTNIETSARLGFYTIETKQLNWLQNNLLSGVLSRPDYFLEYGVIGNYDTPKPVIFHRPIVGTANEVLVDVRSSDNKDRWIILLDVKTGTHKEISYQHDEAWIGGPGISEWNEAKSVLGWIDEKTCYYQSEQSGYSHLYVFDTKEWKERQLTSGEFEIHDVILSRDGKQFYVLLNKIHPGVRNGYSIDVAKGTMTALFEGNFGMEWKLSPDEKNWVIKKSEMLHPESLFYAENKPNSTLRPIQKTESPEYTKLQLSQPEIIAFPADDGKMIHARLYQPANPNGAAVLFVHGAGYLQNAHYYWSYYQREMLFHQLLKDEGYTVLDLDYRGSEGYGRDFRTAIYRNMGNRELKDYINAKDYLTTHYGIDSSRVGIYGGSYGGFLTLMALFKTNDFACGAALRSVTDWAHYNQEYTSNILNYPETDSMAYRRSSPIYFAEGLNKPLLLLHGVEDDNVHFQDIVRLNQRLIELQKKNFWLAIYPVEGHGFKNTDSWIDEYSRIYTLFHTYLK